MIGQRISNHVLKARWAFFEKDADRWRSKYAGYQPERVRQGVRFEQLTSEEIDHLAWMCAQYRRGMTPALDTNKQYECLSWSKDQLGRVYTLPRMGPSRERGIPFLSFLACPRFKNDDGHYDAHDPRFAADAIPFDTPFQLGEPPIVIVHEGFKMLIDGYLRSALFMRAPDPDARIAVWHPVIA